MREIFKRKIIEVCNKKIESKGENVGLLFYVFFVNKNDDLEFFMEVVNWWIMENKLDYFEKVEKIRVMVEVLF